MNEKKCKFLQEYFIAGLSNRTYIAPEIIAKMQYDVCEQCRTQEAEKCVLDKQNEFSLDWNASDMKNMTREE